MSRIENTLIEKTRLCNAARGQVAMEFFIYSGIFLLIVAVALIVVSEIQRIEVPHGEYLVVQQTTGIFSDAFFIAYEGGKGTTYEMDFPVRIFGKNYTIDFNDRDYTMIVEWKGTYGELNYVYRIPRYNYSFEGCLSGKRLESSRCSERLTLFNNGTHLIVRQV